MSIKAGELITIGNQVLINRLQTAGPGNLNIPTEKIEELGNYESVATTRDIADLTFTGESLDVSAEMEALLCNGDFGNDADGTEYDISKALPLDIVSQFKKPKTDVDAHDVVMSVALPFLTLESLSYRFGLRDNAQQSYTLRGDSIFYALASGYVQVEEGSNTENQEIVLENDPIPYKGDAVAGTRYALSVTVVEDGERLTPGVQYTESEDNGEVTITIHDAVPTSKHIRVVYQSATIASYPQLSHAAASATRPAAIKGKDIEVRVGGNTVLNRWSGVQTAQVDYRVTLERDEEMGSAQAIGQDFDVPEVSGSIELRPFDAAALMQIIRQVANVDPDEVVGPYTSQPLSLDILLHSPDDGATLKTIHIPDARFTLPGFQGRVEQKLNVQLPFESDGGVLKVYKGERS